MKYVALINVMPHKELLDPQGKTVAHNIKYLHIDGVDDVRIGKHIRMVVEAESESDANAKVDTVCRKLLANMIMEHYEFTLAPAV
ncbi:MAG: phosphoribosylformylglycinamidine synthase subunit PurS [Saprospiraceae bacterium]|nr:phosphoribosylformylglycinamidine synthase subunit PurS [Saprospiraceae bacterium]